MNVQGLHHAAEIQAKGGGHLTAEQMGELLDQRRGADASRAAAEVHLRACAACAEEVESMREALALFRASATAFARREKGGTRCADLRLVPVQRLAPARLLWMAAGLALAIGMLPVEMHRRMAAPPARSTETAHTTTGANAESDEALLDEINSDLSATLPASMQPLAEPAQSSAGEGAPARATRTN